MAHLKISISSHFRPFLNAMTNKVQLTKKGKSIDGVLGIRTLGRNMESADESTDLWRPQTITLFA